MTTATDVDVADLLMQINSKLDALTTDVGTLATDVGVLKTAVTGLDTRMEKVETRLETLDGHVRGLRQDIHDQGEILKSRFPTVT